MLYRVFPFDPDAQITERGGCLYAPRGGQGPGRHDHPAHYGALYLSRVAESAIAERIQRFRGQILTDADLRLVDGTHYALATFDDAALDPILDLDEPRELVSRQLRPSMVAARDRTVTQAIALRVFEEGFLGLGWWSTLESSWPNVTLFAERASSLLALVGPPEPLTVRHRSVQAAAETVGVLLS